MFNNLELEFPELYSADNREMVPIAIKLVGKEKVTFDKVPSEYDIYKAFSKFNLESNVKLMLGDLEKLEGKHEYNILFVGYIEGQVDKNYIKNDAYELYLDYPLDSNIELRYGGFVLI